MFQKMRYNNLQDYATSKIIFFRVDSDGKSHAWRIVEQSWISFHNQMNRASVSGIMCRIQKYFRNSVIRKKRFHPEKKHAGIHVNHVWKHSKNEEIPVSHFGNQQACTDHSHDNNSRGKNPSRYHSRAGKSSGHTCSQ